MSPRGPLGGRLEHDPAQIRERAAELLARPPYAEQEGALARAWRAAREQVAQTVGRLLDVVAGEPVLAWLLVGIGLVLLSIVVWRASRGLSADRAVEVSPLLGAEGRTSAAWEAEAEADEAAGRWDDAVRARYLALVVGLAEQDVVEDVAARTVGELDRELAAAAPDLAPWVARAGEVFSAVVYGRAPAGPEQAGRVADLAALARRGSRAPATVGEGAP